MIPVLYPANATTFSTFGLGVLTDTISCEVTEERNGVFECLLKYPVSGQHYGLITKECIIKAKPNDTAADQAFRIYRITKPLNGIVTIYGQHISYDLANVPVLPFSTESRSPQLILSQLLAGDTRFTGWTNYSDAKVFSVMQPKSVRACLGGTEGSMLSQWHGEFEWDNFTVKFHSHRGQKTGVIIEYGKNLTALEQDEDNSGVYTALLPYAVYTPEGSDTETVVTLPEVTLPIVTSEIVRAKTLIMDFSDQFDGVVTEEALRAKANSYIKANPLGATIPTVKVSFEPLWKQPEYSALLERVNLCDTVTIRHSLLGVSVSAMVIETVYDTLAERYKSISLGQSKSSMITTISEVQSTVDKVESTVGRFPKLLQTAIGKATGLITGQSGGYVVINTDSESGQPHELLILDAPSIDEAVNVWRWNVGGLSVGKIAKSGSVTVTLTVTDSRGYTASVSQTITVIPYAKPKVSSVTLRRTNDIEAEMQLKFSGSISAVTVDGTQKNSVVYVRYRYKKTSESSYGSYTSIYSGTTKSGTSFSYSNLELCSLDANSSYDFHLQIQDKLYSLSSLDLYFTVPQGTPLIALRKKKVGINTPEPQAMLDVAGDMRVDGSPLADFVIQQGTSGIWNYRKWKSGTAECWGQYSFTTAISTAWGVLYESGAIALPNFPFTFAEIPHVHISTENSNYAMFVERGSSSSWSTTTNPGKIFAVRPNTVPSATYKVSIYAIGKV